MKTVYEDQHAFVASLATHVESRADYFEGSSSECHTSSPRYNPNAKCAYHSNSPGHSTDDCWALKNKIQDMIEVKQIEFDPPVETPNVINAPMPNHDKSSNAIGENSYVFNIDDLTI